MHPIPILTVKPKTWQTGVEFTHIVAESQEAHHAMPVFAHLFPYRPIQDIDCPPSKL